MPNTKTHAMLSLALAPPIKQCISFSIQQYNEEHIYDVLSMTNHNFNFINSAIGNCINVHDRTQRSTVKILIIYGQ